MGKWAKRLGLGLVFLLVGIQFYRPERTNPPEDPAHSIHSLTRMTPEAAALLERSCNDCHSNRTRWPWYSHVAPTSWLVADDVRHARSHMNFSEWGAYPPNKQQTLVEEICDITSEGVMPLGIYTLIHRDAKLSGEDVRTLCEWSKRALQSGGADGASANSDSEPHSH